MSIEKWRDVPDANGRYEVSTHGRVRSYCYTKPRILKTAMMGGYPAVTIYYDGYRKTLHVHQIMGDTFLERNYWVGTDRQINHKDGVKTNNHISNLEIVTHAENSRHAHDLGLAWTPRITKLSEEEVREIHHRLIEGESAPVIARSYDVVPGTIWHIGTGNTWPHIFEEFHGDAMEAAK